MSQQNISCVEDEVAAVANEIWQEEGSPDGRAEEHWQLAQEHLLCNLAAGGQKLEHRHD